MILKTIGIFSAFVCLHGANGASFSKVFVQSGGPEVLPVEYYNYGAPAVIAEPKIAQLSAAPIGSVVSLPSVSNVIQPCVSPCIVGQNIAPVPNAKFIAYNSPNVPVVVAPSKDNGYEYSYVVYDENTGDRKAQREFSDGSVVRGEYSFIQPDGYVREVQYRADDLTGFNVVVKRILPESVGIVEKKHEKSDIPPCKDVKSEALKVEPQHELAIEEHEEHAPEPEINEHDHDQDGVPDHHPSEHVEAEEPAHVVEHDHKNDVAPHPSEHVDTEEHTHEELHEAPEMPEHSIENEHAVENEHAPEPEAEHEEPENHEVPEHNEEPEHDQEEHHEEPAHEESHEAIIVPEEHAPEVILPSLPIPVPEIPASNLVVSYEDIIRCVQARAQAQQGLNVSPLTYIILPAAQRPC